MVRGRLPRESNPVPGQSQPGFVPAFDETGNEDYVRVSNQKPYPVANYTQNPSGVWLPTSQNNPMPTQLTGSKAERLLERGNILTTNQHFNLKRPRGAKGLIVGVRIRGVTGTFSASGGWSVMIAPHLGNDFAYSYVLTSETYQTPGRGSLTYYPGVLKGDASGYQEGFFNKSAGLIVPEDVTVSVMVSGSFGDGEGIEGSLFVEWLI